MSARDEFGVEQQCPRCHVLGCWYHCTPAPAVPVGVEPEPAEERSACGDSVCTNLGCTDACGLAVPVVHPEPGSVTHQCPAEGFGTTGCCGRPPFELPPTDRLSVDEADVTCPGVVHPEPGDRAAMVSKEAEAAAVAAYFEFGRREGFEPFGYPLAAALEAAAPHIVAAAVAAVRADLAREFEERSDGWLRVPPYPNSPAGEKHAAAKAAWLAAAAIARGEL